MRHVVPGVLLIGILSTSLVAQSGVAVPTFELADVHVRPHSSNATPQMTGDVLRGTRYDLRNATMLDMIALAYGVDRETVLDGPNWLDRDRYDIVAKAPAETSADTLKLMVQRLLADRFKLVLHKDTKSLTAYALTVANGKPKMRQSDPNAAPNCQQPPGQGTTGTATAIACTGLPTAQIAELLGSVGGYVTARVVDQTGLQGAWDFELRFTPRNNMAQAGADGITLFAAVEQQLGLKLTLQPIDSPVLVVDAVNGKPTANPSGVADTLPAPPPAEFDVADIKLSPPGATMSGRLQPGGRLDLQGVRMKDLVTIAWDISDDELLAGMPSWYDQTRYSLVARASAAFGGTGKDMRIDIDDVRLMLQKLLAERFNLKTHVEDRPVTAYTLIAEKPKLQPADPANRTRFLNGPAPGMKDPRDASPILNRLVTCQNMTMAQFAEDLPRIANGYIKEPVIDATGLDGAWDFTLNFTGINRLNGPARGAEAGAPAGGIPSAVDPTGGLSLFDAVQRQLGLKLEKRKRPLPVLVIDHIEEQPTGN
jgi:uncharacterized protein (TIGR03435 family)